MSAENCDEAKRNDGQPVSLESRFDGGGLQEFRDEIDSLLTKIDGEGDQIKHVIATLLLSRQVDLDIVSELHGEVASDLRRVTHDRDSVGIGEVAMVLWIELNYIAKKQEGDDCNPTGDDGPSQSSDTASDDVPGVFDVDTTKPQESDGSNRADDPAQDPAFQ